MNNRNQIIQLKGDMAETVLKSMERGNVPTINDGDVVFFNPQESTLAVQCCDCGLVHHFDFKQVRSEEIGFSVIRDNYTTIKYRQNNGILIKHREKINFFRRLFWKSKLIIMAFHRPITTKK